MGRGLLHDVVRLLHDAVRLLHDVVRLLHDVVSGASSQTVT